jgi:hypothetical protein
MIDDVVDRLQRCIVEELSERGHEPGRPLKVAELYEDIVPYRAVRSRLEVELNADYEHALLRLLAGEGDLLRLDQEEVRQELARELLEPYPTVGVFRKFSTSDVWVRLAAPPVSPGVGLDGAPKGEAPAPATRDETPAPAPSASRPPVQAPAPSASRPPVQARAEDSTCCAFCDERLPATPDARFCPFCGRDQMLRPCPRCDGTLEPGWRYCVRCGGAAGE